MSEGGQSIVHGCAAKARFMTQTLADKVAAKRSIDAGRPLRPYYCGLCGGYHLTSRPLPVDVADKARP